MSITIKRLDICSYLSSITFVEYFTLFFIVQDDLESNSGISRSVVKCMTRKKV